MMNFTRTAFTVCIALTSLTVAAIAFDAPFQLVTGVDATQLPGTLRMVSPIPGPQTAPGMFGDGDRLAGTSDAGGAGSAVYFGDGTPLFAPISSAS